LPALVLLSKPLFGLAKRHIQPERYVPFFLKISEIMVTAASMPPKKRFGGLFFFYYGLYMEFLRKSQNYLVMF
jgi:hypothetical protein